ncbi:hypothetical protein JTB14_023712 [Gonioctena quinquepunctata]|nr:hypothetical protein JTB14_023712 [Gonioctena quinquepunctata]
MTPNDSKSGFSATSIYPLNLDEICVEVFAPSSVSECQNPLDVPQQHFDEQQLPRANVMQPPGVIAPTPGTSKYNPKTTSRKSPVLHSFSSGSDIEMSDMETSDEGDSDIENVINTSFSVMLITPDMVQKSARQRENQPSIAEHRL